MNLYHWKSKLLADYGDGNIVVMAENVEQARDKVYELFVPENPENPFWFPYVEMLAHYDGYYEDEEYQEERLKLFNKLREDLNVEPTVVESRVLCFRGSG